MFFLHFTLPIATALKSFRQRWLLAALSDRQLRDAGIDPTLAGRGKAAAASALTLRLQSMRAG